MALLYYRYVYSAIRDSSYRGKGGEFLGGISCFVFVAIFHGKVWELLKFRHVAVDFH